LTNLVLDYNQLKQIKNNSFDSLSQLINISIQFNKIKLIEQNAFGMLRNLTNILGHNKIADINQVFFNNFTLNLLNLSWNRLTEFNSKRTITVNLDLSFNFIRNISFSQIANLTYLNLSNNLLSLDSESQFEKLEQLRSLTLTKNKLISISNLTFKGLSSLESLILDDNQIEFIKEKTFSFIPKCKYLNIINNKIRDIESNAFFNLTYLIEFHLERNFIDQIKEGFFKGLALNIDPKFKKLNLHRNPITFISKNLSFYLIYLDDFLIDDEYFTGLFSVTNIVSLALICNKVQSKTDCFLNGCYFKKDPPSISIDCIDNKNIKLNNFSSLINYFTQISLRLKGFKALAFPLIYMDAIDTSSTSDNNNQMNNESDEWSYSDCHFEYEHENEEIFPFPEECEAFSNDCGECYTHEKCFFGLGRYIELILSKQQ